ncbi:MULTISPECIES: class I SAM-dependent methyltransferase [Thermoactinomyces]|uniref:Class I SAM-dependent methyltransferase n=1 Tax=Thermoactinomyces daqus TaxID=1329516 RepID=A0A7W2AJK4_9BACL|nr:MULTISPECIES: class I SAM-dependent methyltransferase [Thermoactinomyces]MBA4544500.1 class I SAM-dependent methyltransferase [Thermoactinomyces daqus]MBH8599679.1 class I SAM-dependent methyltransferase [Thermoactinomyces sp. CICC 10523]MBH8605966.1 class I SAM-dependent methyltransferase [Thermoactinomyces sp. CICC 10522]
MGSEALFNSLFDQWAEDYDQAVAGGHPEYIEVFEGYANILKSVVDSLALPKGSVVMEFGVGTGNLTSLLFAEGYRVIGIEPSAAMREKAKAKLPDLELHEGHFLNVPSGLPSVDAIVSTYAFHHLTDEMKDQALRDLVKRLNPGGKIAFADTVFRDEGTKLAMQREAEERGFHELALDLKREYYPVMSRLERAFCQAGLTVRMKQLNRYVWLMVAELNREA